NVPIVDFTSDSESIEDCSRKKQARIVLEPVGRCVDIPLDGRNHAVAVTVDARHLGSVCIKKPALQVMVPRLKRRESFINIQEDLVCEAARNIPKAKLTLSIVASIEFVRISR